MQVKRFFAADMRQAMKLVRDELGADAAILSNRRVAGGIELTAALDYQAPTPTAPNVALEAELRKTQVRIAEAHAELAIRSPSAGLTTPQAKDSQVFGSNASTTRQEPVISEEKPAQPTPAVAAVSAAEERRALDAVRSEITGLRELIEVQLGSIAWGQMQDKRPDEANFWRRLQRMGLPADLCRDLMERVAHVKEPRQAWRMLLAHLTQALDTPQVDLLEEGGIVALVGPAGSGKTTTLSKMAASYVLKYGAQSLALVTMDSHRIGAQEQIKTLGHILDVPVTVVDPRQSLAQALEPLSRKRMILIDTAGLPANDPALRLQLEALASEKLKIRSYLVMAVTSQSQVLKASYHNYKGCGLAGCILTKLDESATLGEALGIAIGHHIPVAYLSDGPRIPDDLHIARKHQLVSRAVNRQLTEEPAEETMADMFAELYQKPTKRVG